MLRFHLPQQLMKPLQCLSNILKCPYRLSSLVPSRLDEHNCFHFDLSNLPEKELSSPKWRCEFLEELTSLCLSKPQYNAIWVHMSPAQGSLLPDLSNPTPKGPGLILHHARDNSISLYRWLCTGKDRVPAFATHQIGVVAATMRIDKKVLLVREKNKNTFQGWKFPSGRIGFGESFADAALREMHEETGLQKVDFHSLLGVRETYDELGASELLALCHLNSFASIDEISTSMRPCPWEIKEMDWFPLSSIFEAHICRKVDELKEKEMMGPCPPLCITPLTRIIADMLHHFLSVQEEGGGNLDTFNGFTRSRIPSVRPGHEHIIYIPPLISSSSRYDDN